MTRNLQSVADFAAGSRGAFTEGQIRWWLFKSNENGLVSSGAVVRIGRRVYLDIDAFDRWLTLQNSDRRLS